MNHDGAYSFSKVSVTDKMLTPSHTDGARLFEGFVLYYVLGGEGAFFAEGEEYPLTEGALVLVPPSFCHGVRAAEARFSYREITFHTDTDALILRSQDGEIAYPLTTVALFDKSKISKPIASSIIRIADTDSLPRWATDAYRAAVLTEIIILLSCVEAGQLTREDNSLGARIMRYVDENLTENLSLDTLARAFFVSKYHLCRAFKAYHGISAHSYIIKKRVLLARRLIEGGEAPSSVAYKVGFGDYSAFYRAYRKVTGSYPAAEAARDK